MKMAARGFKRSGVGGLMVAAFGEWDIVGG
jgi:hypothetical protein